MSKLTNRIVSTTFTALLLSVVSLFSGCSTFSDYSYASYRQGKANALRDIEANILAVETYGFGMNGDGGRSHLLRERYNIETRIVAGCIVNEKIVGHAKGYNEVSRAEIERRFGKDIWDKVRQEILLQREKQQAGQVSAAGKTEQGSAPRSDTRK
jgi:hypothetical protein